MIVGLSGYAQSGKDTAAKALIDHYGFERRAFADILRQALYALNPLVFEDGLDEWYFDPEDTSNRVQPIVDRSGWEAAKQYPEVRRLLQRLGTEVGRELLGENVWVDAAMRGLTPNRVNYVFTDVRFPNEAQAIVSTGGIVVRIERSGVDAINAHPSETALDNWSFDAVLRNDGSVRDLHDSMRRLVHWRL